MSRYFWFYLILQSLIMLLIYQVLSDNRTLNLELRQGQCQLTGGNTLNEIQYRTCAPPKALQLLQQLKNQMHWNVFGSGYDQTLRTQTHKTTKTTVRQSETNYRAPASDNKHETTKHTTVTVTETNTNPNTNKQETHTYVYETE